MAIGFFEYYDPDTGMLHIWGHDLQNSLAGSSSETLSVGLSDTTFTDVSIKIVSITYQAKIFCSTAHPYSANEQMFDPLEYAQSGFVLVGVANQNHGTLNDLNDFEGTSGWPVDLKSYAVTIGNTASFTKTWKPRKLALSHEQQAILTVRALQGGNTVDSAYMDTSIYIRGIRL